MSFFSKSKLAALLVPAAVSLALDLSTKGLIKANLEEFSMIRVSGFLNLILTYNTGAAFSLFAGSGAVQGLKMAILAILAMAPLVWLYRMTDRRDKLTLVSLGLVVGGALGNVHDRLRYDAVVDFLDFHLGDRHWPTFNGADVFICLGLGFLLLFTVFKKGPKSFGPKKDTMEKSGQKVRPTRKRP
ncbi:MAG: signal peptidase II [Deltaproteobacteria bacterium]|nr:signal peptidase II [Deltaproteobacteria bacterium]